MSKYKPHFAHIHQKDNSSSCFASSFSHNMLPLKPPPASLLHASMHSCSQQFSRGSCFPLGSLSFIIRHLFAHTEAGWNLRLKGHLLSAGAWLKYRCLPLSDMLCNKKMSTTSLTKNIALGRCTTEMQQIRCNYPRDVTIILINERVCISRQ